MFPEQVVPPGPVGSNFSQDHQEISILSSDVTETHETLSLPPAVISNPVIIEDEALPPLSSSAQKPWLNVFLQNITPPTPSVTFPQHGALFENTAQLAYYSNLLRNYLYPSPIPTTTSIPDESFHLDQQILIELYTQKGDEGIRIASLIQRVIDEFAADNLKIADDLSDVILLAPSLDQEHYRVLLICVIVEFETAKVLDFTLLQGLIQLIECALSNYLKSTDLVRILVVLNAHLQDIHQQSTKQSHYLTWALSRLLDIVVEGKVRSACYAIGQEPLSSLFNRLKDTDDPYLKRQATYAFQSFMHVPNNETHRQCMLQYTGNITMGLLGVTSVCELDMAQLYNGTDSLYNAAGEACKAHTRNDDGARSLSESGQGIWARVKGGIFSGERQLWYTSLREAQQHIRNGRLHDFNKLVFEAPCRDHIDFQWGICLLLGNVATDPLWEANTRQKSIDFLAELHGEGSIWTPSKDIYRWILDILHVIISLKDTVVSDYAQLVLLGLENAGDASQQESYHEALVQQPCIFPIQARLPIPASSRLLSRVSSVLTIERDVIRLKNFRLKEQENTLYIQPQAKPSLQSSDDTLFPLMDKVLEFLTGPGLVFLLLGDSGGGKSTFNLQLERTLWKSYKNGDPIPLHINLPSIDCPDQDMVAKRLQQLNFDDTQIKELKHNREFTVICDGYDESHLTTNIHTSNCFNQPGQWKVKMIVTCRTQYLGPDYSVHFEPLSNSHSLAPTPDLFQEAVIAPFTKQQIQKYVNMYVTLESRTWDTEEYMVRLNTIPNLIDLVKNPFLLSLALEALPGVIDGARDLTAIKITRVQLYDMFVKHWLEVNHRRQQKTYYALSSEDRYILEQLTDAGFVSMGMEYSAKLAQAIFDNQDGNPIVQYNHLTDRSSWKVDFFGPGPEVKLLRNASPLTRTGSQYRFVHRSIQEYFFSLLICNSIKDDGMFDLQAETVSTSSRIFHANNPIFQRNLLQEPSVINFLCDRVKLNPEFTHQLHALIDQSKKKIDNNVAIAAANAITILVRAGVLFNNADLRNIKVPDADLSNGQFDSAQFQGADLRGVNFSRSWLRQANMSNAHMEGIRFGELPYLEMENAVYSCAYSTDGEMFGAAIYNGAIYIYDTSTWTRMHYLQGHSLRVWSIAFSSDSHLLVSGSGDKTVRLWNTTSGEELLVLEGHMNTVYSVTISSCGNQIASASRDTTIALWNAQTGERMLELKGHTLSVMSVKYSPDGEQLVSGCSDGTIRIWNPRTGDLVKNSSSSFGKVTSLAYPPSGRWYAAGHELGQLQLWDAITLEPGPVLSGHTDTITGIDFSSDGRWIASSSDDKTVRVWDTSTNTLVSVLTGHNHYVNCVAYSHDGRQIASGGYDRKVRLWEVAFNWLRPDPSNGGCVMKLAYSCNGQSILSYDEGGVFRQWDATTGSSLTIPYKMPEEGTITSRAYSPNGSQLAFGYKNGSIRIWNCQKKTVGPVLEGHSVRINLLVYSLCSRWFVSVDSSRAVRLWDLHDVELQPLLVEVNESLDGDIRTVAFSSTGGQFAIDAEKDTLCLFDTQSRERLGQLKLEGIISSLAYSPDNQEIAIGTGEGRFYLWDLQSKEPGTRLKGHEGWVRSIAYSPCGKWITSAIDKTVGIWHRQMSGEAESWSRVHSICAFFGWVGSVAWDPVVPLELVTCATDGSIQVWRMSVHMSERIVVKLVWGSNLTILCTDNATIMNTVGLSPMTQKLLVQRGAFLDLKGPISPHG